MQIADREYFDVRQSKCQTTSMNDEQKLLEVLARIEGRLDEIEIKVDSVKNGNRKSLEWIGMLSEHVRDLDAFREEVRASFEPLCGKLDNIDEVVRILRHATVDISKRVEGMEHGEALSA